MQRTNGQTLAWTGFLAAAFGVVGLVGAFAIYAAQLPFDRAAARSQALEQAVADAGDAAALERLRPLLGDSAGPVLDGGAPAGMAARAGAERTRTIAALHAEAADIGTRLRVVLAGFTAAAALFGAFVLGAVRRS